MPCHTLEDNSLIIHTHFGPLTSICYTSIIIECAVYKMLDSEKHTQFLLFKPETIKGLRENVPLALCKYLGKFCGFLLENIHSSVTTQYPCSSSWQAIIIQEREGISQYGVPNGNPHKELVPLLFQEQNRQGSREVNQPMACVAFITCLQSI